MFFQRCDIANATIDNQADHPGRLRRNGEYLTPVASNKVAGAYHQHAATGYALQGQMQGQVVTWRTLQRVSRGGDKGTLPDRPDFTVYGARQMRSLIQRRAAQGFGPLVKVVHQAFLCRL